MLANKIEIEGIREKAKKLSHYGMKPAEIAEVLNLSYELLKKWHKEPDFQEIQRCMQMRLSHMKRTLLLSFEEHQSGKTPVIRPAQLLQYAQAYEKLSNQKNHLGCWYDAFEQLTENLLLEVEVLQTTKAKMAAIRRLKELRRSMENTLQSQIKEACS